MVKIGSRRTKMKKKCLLIITILILITLSACGPAPTPTLSVAEIQATAFADAWISITQTQAAIPTATETPIPTATFTALPTFTLMPLSTLPPLVIPTQTSAGVDPCYLPQPAKPKGVLVIVTFVNKSGGHADATFGMNQPNSFNECGAFSFSLGKYGEQTITVLAGCYYSLAYIKDPDSFAHVGSLCVTDPKQIYKIWIGKETINFH